MAINDARRTATGSRLFFCTTIVHNTDRAPNRVTQITGLQIKIRFDLYQDWPDTCFPQCS